MKIALISDIHGNWFYLDSVSTRLAAEKVDLIYCLGDLVGYYDAPDAVIDWCIRNDVICIKGNHEKYLLNELTPDPQKEPFYRTRLHHDALTKAHLEFLKSLPDSIEARHEGRSFYLTHSLPGDCVGYAYDVQQLDRDFLLGYDYYCFGHTHIPMIRYHYGTAVVNPGSIGQPRDFSRQPSYAVIDLETDTLSLRKMKVDYQSYCQALLEKKFDPKMVEVLQRAKQ